MILYVTSDTHFNHKSIQGLNGIFKTRKQFSSVENMNETIIRNWNAIVSPEDEVIHAGDIAMDSTPEETLKLLKKLNGNLTIVPGNHDSVAELLLYLENQNYIYNNQPKFTIKEVGLRIEHENKVYFITHFPLVVGEHRPEFRNFCGHIHEYATTEANLLNIGVDSPEIPEVPFGSPISFEIAVKLVEEKWNKWAKENGLGRVV